MLTQNLGQIFKINFPQASKLPYAHKTISGDPAGLTGHSITKTRRKMLRRKKCYRRESPRNTKLEQ